MTPTRFIVILAWALLCSSPRSTFGSVEASDIEVDCPSPDDAFVTTCTGGQPERPLPENTETTATAQSFGESDFVNEDQDESKEYYPPPRQQTYISGPMDSMANNKDSEQNGSSEAGCPGTECAAAMQQLKQTTKKLVQRYYDPLPRQGKRAFGTLGGFAASRLALGAANRVLRLAGATWVLSEVLHASGICDEARCVPEEARPWVGILHRALIKQCIKVRIFARRIWDGERIRGIVRKDEIFAGGVAVGAFIGFII